MPQPDPQATTMDSAGASAKGGKGGAGGRRAKSFDPKYAGATREELDMLRYVDPTADTDAGATLGMEVRTQQMRTRRVRS